jgi:hypothetical protein
MTHTFLLKCNPPLGDAKGPFRPSRGESTRAGVHLYLAGARGGAAGICNGADVRANSGSLEPLRRLLDVNVEISVVLITIFSIAFNAAAAALLIGFFLGVFGITLSFSVCTAFKEAIRFELPSKAERPVPFINHLIEARPAGT